MTEDELHNVVRHLAQLHGVTPEEIVTEVVHGGDHHAGHGGAAHGVAATQVHAYRGGYAPQDYYDETCYEGDYYGDDEMPGEVDEYEADEAADAELGGQDDGEGAPKRRRSRAGRIAWWSSMVVVGGLVGVVV